MPPFLELLINFNGLEALWPLGYTDQSATLVEFINDPVAVESFVGQQAAKLEPADQWCDPNRVISVAGQEFEAHQIAKGIGECQDFRRPSAFRLTYSLALSPPFAP